MATVDEKGVHPTTLQEYIAILEARFQGEFGDELALDPETPQGQIIGIMALSLSEADENLVELSQAVSLDSAADIQLDELGALLDIRRLPGRKSRVTANLRGDTGVGVPTGTLASTAAGDNFATTEDVVLISGNDVSVVFEAVEEGAIPAAAGALTQIVTPLPGLDSVTNPNAASLGVAEETDDEYRVRFSARTAQRAFGSADALEAAILAAGATGVRVEENNTNVYRTVQGFTLAPHSFMAIVEGGSDGDVAAAIARINGVTSPARKGLGAAAMAGIGGAAVTDPDDILSGELNRSPYEFNFAGEVLTLALPTTDSTVIVGGATPTAPGSLTQNDYSLSINSVDIEDIDLSAATTGALVATALQTALRAAAATSTFLADAVVEYTAADTGVLPRYTVTLPSGEDTGSFAAHSLGTGTDLSAPLKLTSGTVESYAARAATSGTAFASQLQTVLRTATDPKVLTSSVYFHPDGYFQVLFPWFDGFDAEFRETGDSSARRFLPQLLKMAGDDFIPSPGPFIRTADSTLSVALEATITHQFPSGGLDAIRNGLINVVKEYEIGATPWQNDFLVAVESVRGVRVTSLTVREGLTDVASIVAPLNRRWQLGVGNLSITLTR